MMRHLILLLLIVATAAAQPLTGPFEVVNTHGTAALTNPHVAVRNGSIADVFYQLGDSVLHAAVAIETGNIVTGPTMFPMTGTGWARQLCDVVIANDGWAALVYDATAGYNRTIVSRGLDTLDSGLVVDSGTVMYSGEWISVSINHALALSPRTGGGFFASWLNEWEYDNPWFWGEAGAGPVALSFASGDSFRICGNSFFGPWPEEGLSVDVFGSESDSDIVLICGDYSGITFSRPLWNNNTGFGIQELHFIFRGARSVGALFTEGDVLFLVSRSFTTRPAELLRIDNLSACTVVQTLNDEPIIAASHPDFGIAWLARYGTGLVLYRADTTGAPVFPAGAIHWPSEGHEIVEAALSLSDDGLLVAAWTERETGYDQPTILRIASVGWDTYLEVEESRFILHPSSFILSAFPNPFNSVLQIEYELAHSSELDLAVYNLIGQRVETLQHGVQEAGTYRATWLPKSAGGIYFVTLTTDAASRTAKVLYLR